MRKFLFILLTLPLYSYSQFIVITSSSLADAADTMQSFVITTQDKVGETSLTSGLVSFWQFGETSGTTAYDSVSVYHGTHTNTPTLNQPGVCGQCYRYDRSSEEYLDFGSNFYDPDTNDLSISGWIKLDSVGLWQGIIGNAGGDNWWHIYLKDSDTLYGVLNLSDTAIQVETKSNEPLLPNEWYHWVYMLDRDDSAELWINGVRQSDVDDISNFSSTSIYNSNNHVIGNHGEYGGYYTEGYIDEIGIWSRLLTATEIGY
jgi:hypothetical protein